MISRKHSASVTAHPLRPAFAVAMALVLALSPLSVWAADSEAQDPQATEATVQTVPEEELLPEDKGGDQELDATNVVDGGSEAIDDATAQPPAAMDETVPEASSESGSTESEEAASQNASVDEDEPAEYELVFEVPPVEEEPGGNTDGDELFGKYIEQCFDEELPSHNSEGVVLQAQAVSLSGADLKVYNLLLPKIRQVASSGGVTTFTFALTDVFTTTSWTPSDLGVSAIVTNGTFNNTAITNAEKKVKINLAKILRKLCNDLPYELYWYDKTASTSIGGISFSWNSRSNMLRATGNVTIKFPVAKGYATSTYVVDGSKAKSVAKAVQAASDIVNAKEMQGKSSYERLLFYRERICDLTSYNSAAAKGGVAYGDPWQLVYVFDNNPSTTVVCEGYSKAFQYLCDLSNFSDVKCRMVTGTMSGGTGAGAHMWNIVTMPNGKNYLVDVTNCDAGTVGADTLLFLAGYASGSVSGGYTVNAKKSMTYRYDSDTTGYYTTAELTLNKGGYNQSSSGGSSSGGSTSGSTSGGTSLSGATITVSNTTYTGSAQTPAPTVKLGAKTLTKNTDYTVTYSNNINAGTATAKITGKGSYSGTASKTFTIAKKAQSVTVANTKLSVAMGKTVNVGAKASAGGKLTYASSNTAVATVSSTGVVTPRKVGTVTITAKAAATTNYNAASRSVTVTVTQGAQTITAANKSVVLGKTAAIGAKTSGNGKLTYKSSNTSIATVNANGVITGKRIGTAKITISAARTSNFKAASRTITVTVKRANTVTASASRATVIASATRLKSAAQVLANNVKVSKAQGTVSYANGSTNATAKKFTVNASTGKVTVPKGTRAGTYPVIIRVMAKGNGYYFGATRSVAYKVQVK